MLEETAVEGGERYNYLHFMIDKHMVQWCFLLCNNYAQLCVVFDAVMQSGFSLCHTLVPVFYFGRGCPVVIITRLLLERGLVCGCLCVFSALLCFLPLLHDL